MERNVGPPGEPDLVALYADLNHRHFSGHLPALPVHLALGGDGSTNHGSPLRAELRRLADARAFEGIAATDAERATVRAWLDAEAVRLNHDQREVKAIGAAIDAARAAFERASPSSKPGLARRIARRLRKWTRYRREATTSTPESWPSTPGLRRDGRRSRASLTKSRATT